MQSRRARRTLVRLGTSAAALVLLACAAPASATEPSAPSATGATRSPRVHRGHGGGLFLLSFLVPLPIPMAFVAPVSERPEPAAPPATAGVQVRAARHEAPARSAAPR